MPVTMARWVDEHGGAYTILVGIAFAFGAEGLDALDRDAFRLLDVAGGSTGST
jgi:hypothetical protein